MPIDILDKVNENGFLFSSSKYVVICVRGVDDKKMVRTVELGLKPPKLCGPLEYILMS